jgi:hypothetical protein
MQPDPTLLRTSGSESEREFETFTEHESVQKVQLLEFG